MLRLTCGNLSRSREVFLVLCYNRDFSNIDLFEVDVTLSRLFESGTFFCVSVEAEGFRLDPVYRDGTWSGIYFSPLSGLRSVIKQDFSDHPPSMCEVGLPWQLPIPPSQFFPENIKVEFLQLIQP